jgi:sugar-phosphatase
VREIAPALDIDAEVAWLAAAELSDTAGLSALPGASSVFHAVPDERRAVVTSGGRDLARLRLQHVGFPVPGVLVAAEDVSAGKPALTFD